MGEGVDEDFERLIAIRTSSGANPSQSSSLPSATNLPQNLQILPALTTPCSILLRFGLQEL